MRRQRLRIDAGRGEQVNQVGPQRRIGEGGQQGPDGCRFSQAKQHHGCLGVQLGQGIERLVTILAVGDGDRRRLAAIQQPRDQLNRLCAMRVQVPDQRRQSVWLSLLDQFNEQRRLVADVVGQDFRHNGPLGQQLTVHKQPARAGPSSAARPPKPSIQSPTIKRFSVIIDWQISSARWDQRSSCGA